MEGSSSDTVTIDQETLKEDKYLTFMVEYRIIHILYVQEVVIHYV